MATNNPIHGIFLKSVNNKYKIGTNSKVKNNVRWISNGKYLPVTDDQYPLRKSKASITPLKNLNVIISSAYSLL